MLETTIYYLYTNFYIPAIKRLAFNLPHMRILVTNHCGELRHTVFKRRKLFQYFLYHCDYADRVVVSFAHQLQP